MTGGSGSGSDDGDARGERVAMTSTGSSGAVSVDKRRCEAREGGGAETHLSVAWGGGERRGAQAWGARGALPRASVVVRYWSCV